MDWWGVLELILALVVGGLINWWFARRSSRELRLEADRLRRLTTKLIDILAAQGKIEVSTRDPETGEPSSWPVGTEREIRYNVEEPPKKRPNGVQEPFERPHTPGPKPTGSPTEPTAQESHTPGPEEPRRS
jgi:hypothetical protein